MFCAAHCVKSIFKSHLKDFNFNKFVKQYCKYLMSHLLK